MFPFWLFSKFLMAKVHIRGSPTCFTSGRQNALGHVRYVIRWQRLFAKGESSTGYVSASAEASQLGTSYRGSMVLPLLECRRVREENRRCHHDTWLGVEDKTPLVGACWMFCSFTSTPSKSISPLCLNFYFNRLSISYPVVWERLL